MAYVRNQTQPRRGASTRKIPAIKKASEPRHEVQVTNALKTTSVKGRSRQNTGIPAGNYVRDSKHRTA